MHENLYWATDIVKCWPVLFLTSLYYNLYFLYKKVPSLMYNTVRILVI